VLVGLICGAAFAGFQALSVLIGVYQVPMFLRVSVYVYLYLLVIISFVFDLRLKGVRPLERSRWYYEHNKRFWRRWILIVGRAAKLRFQYLLSWQHFTHFVNYLVLPSIWYWAVVCLIFLNPFDPANKQILIAVGTAGLAVVLWFLKTVFQNYPSAKEGLHAAMFAATCGAAFAAFSAALGATWYFGATDLWFVGVACVIGALAMYQSLFRELKDPKAPLGFYEIVLLGLGTVFVGFLSAVVVKYWTINYFTGGLLVADGLYLYWGLVLLSIRGRLFMRVAAEYAVVFFFVLFFILATTNFEARIG
jgi:hypothetical protein